MARYEYIDSQRNDLAEAIPVVTMCRWLMVSTSGFYHWRKRPQSATAARRELLANRIKYYFDKSDGTHGYQRIHADLADERTECSPELVRQIMRQQQLVPCQPRPFRVTTQADSQAAAGMPDLVNQDFPPQAGGAPAADRPGIKFVGDITYIHTSWIPAVVATLVVRSGCGGAEVQRSAAA